MNARNTNSPVAIRTPKPWGAELLWAQTGDYAGKILLIEEGHRLSLQHHEYKEETILVLDGELLLWLEDEYGEMHTLVLTCGMRHHIPAGRKHRFEALRHTRLVEVSTPHLDDVVRHQDDYGRAGIRNSKR